MVATVAAQRGVVFQHGINSTGDTWAQAADRLSRDYSITPYRPTTSSFEAFETQAGQLAGQVVGAGTNAIIIGHSNGGLLARAANRPEVQNRPWGGVITVGTLHGGAPLAGAVLSGAAGRYGQYLASSIVRPFAYYSQWQADWRDRWYWDAAAAFAQQLYWFAQYFPFHIASAGIGASFPVVSQMPPGSTFLNNLNSSANLARESSALPYRIGVTSSVNTYAGIMWKGLTPDSWQRNTIFQYTTFSLLLATYEHYRFYDNYDDPDWWYKQQYAYLWLYAASAVYGMDNAWCGLIGAQSGFFRCAPSDGIVPTTSQVYPGGTATFSVSGPAHLQETRDAGVESALNTAFSSIGITPCSRAGSITVSPSSANLYAGSTAQASASVQSVCGRYLAVPVSWSSSNAGIARVNGSGLITGVAPGTATIYASRDGVSGAVAVTVKSGGSGGPTSVTISGPTSVDACTADIWSASTVGGTAPLSYSWSLNGKIVKTGSTSWVEYQNIGGSTLTIRVTVTDAQGYSRTSSSFSVDIQGLCQ